MEVKPACYVGYVRLITLNLFSMYCGPMKICSAEQGRSSTLCGLVIMDGSKAVAGAPQALKVLLYSDLRKKLYP